MNPSPTGEKTEIEKLNHWQLLIDDCCNARKRHESDNFEIHWSEAVSRSALNGLLEYAIEYSTQEITAAKRTSEVEKERDTFRETALGAAQTILELQSKLATAEKVRNDAVREMQACHGCWNDFTAKVCEVLPSMNRAPLFQQSDVIVSAVKERDELVRKFRAANFPLEQATTCGKCGVYKHTPWRDDDFGYVCATCLVAIKDGQISSRAADVKVKGIAEGMHSL